MRKITSLFLIVAVLFGVSACSIAYGDNGVKPVVTSDVSESQEVLKTLQWADSITVSKKMFSLNDQYEVYADDVKVGEIRGQYIYLIGDTFSLFSVNENLVASEGEGYRVINHRADLFDYNNEPTGKIQEDFSWFLTRWSMFDVEGEKIGSAEQNFSFLLDFSVLNTENEVDFQIKKEFSYNAKLTITRISSEPSIPAINAVWLAVIANEIAEAQAESE